MSRSLGDLVAAKLGVTCDPEVLVHPLTNHDKFIIIASDGVWEFMDNDQVASMCLPFYQKGWL